LYENYRHEELRHSNSDQRMEFDIFLPKEQVALEYQGEHHYWNIYSVGSSLDRQKRDIEKGEVCLNKGISLIQIPYWWDKRLESLISTIHHKRPDLIPNNFSEAIPVEPPQGFPKDILHLMHGIEWDGVQDLTGW
jgi:hypothetical protein